MVDLVLNRLRLKGLRVKKQRERCSPVFYTPVSSFSENKQSPKKVTVRERELNLYWRWMFAPDKVRLTFLTEPQKKMSSGPVS